MMKVKTRAILITLFLVALGIRLWFLWQLQADPVFRMPVGDPKEFNFWAFYITQGHWLWPQVQNHTPLYPYFLAGIYKVFGFQVNAAALIQSVLGAASACLMYVLTLRLVNPVAALVCAGLMSVYWLFILSQVHLYSENLAMFLNIGLISCLIFFRNSYGKFLATGTLLGLSLLCRPDILPFAVVILWWIWRQDNDHRRGLAFYGLFLLAACIVLSPVLMRNQQISGQWLLRSQVGMNIFLGNSPQYLGTNIFVEQGRSFYELSSMPYRGPVRDHKLSEAEIDKFFIQKTLQTIREQPVQWLALLSGKVWSVMTGREFLRPQDVYFRDLYVRKTPVILFSTQVIFILAVAGLLISWWEHARLQLLYVLLVSTLGSFFFPTKTLYLVPVMPFVMLFAALAVASVYLTIREGRFRVAAQRVALILVLTALSFFNPLGLREPSASEAYYQTASNLQYLQKYQLSEKYFRMALALDPHNITAEHELGILYLQIGDYKKALECFDQSRRMDAKYAQWEQTYYDRTQAMLEHGQSASDNYNGLTQLERENDPLVRRYLEYFRYP